MWQGVTLDLTVKNVTAYDPHKSERNGKSCVKDENDVPQCIYGQINLKSDRRTDLELCFEDSSTNQTLSGF